MNCLYALMRDRHASNECLLGEQEPFLITAGKKSEKTKNTQNTKTNPAPFFGACFDGFWENAHIFHQLEAPRKQAILKLIMLMVKGSCPEKQGEI